MRPVGLLTAEEVAAQAGVSSTTLTKYKRKYLQESVRRDGVVAFRGPLGTHAVRCGGRVFFRPSVVDVVRTLRDSGLEQRGKR